MSTNPRRHRHGWRRVALPFRISSASQRPTRTGTRFCSLIWDRATVGDENQNLTRRYSVTKSIRGGPDVTLFKDVLYAE
jgi:hypothetical protein